MRKQLVQFTGFFVLSLIGFGCNFGPPTPPSIPLTSSQVRAVLACQDEIKEEGRNFTTVKLAHVEECLDNTLQAVLKHENGQISDGAYNDTLISLRAECSKKFKQVGSASSKLISDIVAECGPVQSIILPGDGYDPLQFEALSAANPSGFGGFSSVSQLAGDLCSTNELAVDAILGYQVPRMANLLEILDNDSGQFAIQISSSPGLVIPNIPLDPGCVALTRPPT